MQTVTKILIMTFVIVRHTCHRCLYILVIVIFAVVVCTINFFIKTYVISPFFNTFKWIWTFCNNVIFISTSKTFWGIHSVCLFSKSKVTQDLYFSFLILIFFSAEWLAPSQKLHFVWKVCLLSHYFYHTLICCQDLNCQSVRMIKINIFYQYIFLVSLTLPGGYIFEQIIFHLGESYPEICATVDILSEYFLLRLAKPLHFEIYWCISLMTILLYVLLAGKLCHTHFCQQNSCSHNVIELFKYIYFHIYLELRNSSSDMHINIGMQMIRNSLPC